MNAESTYLDHAATTPVDPEVIQAMVPYFSEEFGNPSSIHQRGQRANAALETARTSLADSLGCRPSEIVFTSCGSESNNLAIRGAAIAGRQRRGASHILSSPVEHPAVLETVKRLDQGLGFDIEMLPVDKYGVVSPADVAARLRPETALVSVMYANNEIGTLNPIPEIAAACRAQGIPFHTDAVQAAAFMALNVSSLGVDLLSLSAHKFYGPKGVGVLFVREGIPLEPIQTGGSQEAGLRAGTQNVPLIVGMATALALARQDTAHNAAHVSALRDRIIGGVLDRIADVQLTGHPTARLPNHASFVLQDVDAGQLLAALDLEGFACSSGSACHAGITEPSQTLLALGIPAEWALGSLRVTVGKTTTSDEVDRFLNSLEASVRRIRGGSGSA